jgi:hypothetical protein
VVVVVVVVAPIIGPCHVSGIFLPLRVNSLPLATIYEVKIPLRKWKISLLQRNPAQMTWAIVLLLKMGRSSYSRPMIKSLFTREYTKYTAGFTFCFVVVGVLY